MRRDQLDFGRRRWRRFTIALLIAALGIAVVAWPLPAGFWRGLVIGVLEDQPVAEVDRCRLANPLEYIVDVVRQAGRR